MGMMVNTTFAIDASIREAFLDWLRQCFIPSACDAGARHVIASRVIGQRLDGPMDDEADAYACQFQMESSDAVAVWVDTVASKVLGERHARWGDRFLPFVTFMETLDL